MDYFLSPDGGTEGQFYALISNIDKSRFDIEVCFLYYPSDYFLKNSFPVKHFSINQKKIKSFSSVIKLVELISYIRFKKFNLIHSFFNDSVTISPIISLLSGSKHVTSRRDMGYWYTKNRLLFLRAFSKLTHYYLVNSYAVYRNTIAQEKVDPKRIKVIYNSLDNDKLEVSKYDNFYKKYNIPCDAIIIGIVANLRPIKRVDDLIHAGQLILKKHFNVFFVSIGDTSLLGNDYINLCKKLKVDEHFRFLGNLEKKLAYSIIKCFDISINCSESEGLSNSILEYLALGIPVIATSTGGNKELVKNAYNGLLYPVGNVKALADAINFIIENPKKAEFFTRNGITFIRERFSIERMVQEHENVYRGLVLTKPTASSGGPG